MRSETCRDVTLAADRVEGGRSAAPANAVRQPEVRPWGRAPDRAGGQGTRDRRRGVRPGSPPRETGRRGRGGRRRRAGRGGRRRVAGSGGAGCLGHDLPFVCVPAGTRNHFARDLGLDPTDPTAALDAINDGVEGRIDVGEVNGRVFLNNVSLGIYAEAIRRAGYRDAKVRTLLETARPVLGPATEISALKVVDDSVSTTATRRSCWCRTTRTRSAGRSLAAAVRR